MREPCLGLKRHAVDPMFRNPDPVSLDSTPTLDSNLPVCIRPICREHIDNRHALVLYARLHAHTHTRARVYVVQ